MQKKLTVSAVMRLKCWCFLWINLYSDNISFLFIKSLFTFIGKHFYSNTYLIRACIHIINGLWLFH